MYYLNSPRAFLMGLGAILLVTLLLAGCKEKKNYTVPTQVNGWTARYGDVSNCTSFSFGEPHYCINNIPVKLGQTIRIKITVAGELRATEGVAPAQIHLFLWRRGDNLTCLGGPTGFQGYRYWSRQGIVLTPGTHELSVKVDAAEWTDCYGQSNPEAFAATVGNLLAVGYSFGGEFYGHGVTGRGKFQLNHYIVE